MGGLLAKWTISSDELNTEIKAGNIKLVDVREPEENLEARIENSTLIPLDEISIRGPKELDPNSDIILYCAHGVRSMHALMALKQSGFQKLRSLEGGIASWIQAGYPYKSGQTS